MAPVRAPLRALLASTVVGLAVLAGCRGAPGAATPGSTLRATLVDHDGDGHLEAGPAEPLRPRRDLAPPARVARTLVTLGLLSDAHVTDEESPLRLTVLDRLGAAEGGVSSAARPQEALTAQVLAAAETSLDAAHPNLVLVTGDLVDDAQRNELDLAVRVLRGGRVEPDSGAPGYDGPQGADAPDPFRYRPDVDAPRHPGLLTAAQRPFRAPGLRAPFLVVPSNHDLEVQGVVPTDPALARVAVGARRLDVPSQALLDAARAGVPPAGVVDRFLAGGRAGTYRRVAPDRRRAPLSPAAALRRLAALDRVGLDGGRLHLVRRLAPGLRLVVLDTAPRTGATGTLPPEELAWLRRSTAQAGTDALLVVSQSPLEDTAGGGAALELLDRAPHVLAVLSGDTHRNRIRPRRTAHGGYWLIRAPSLVDYPQQARVVRVERLVDGRLALATWVVDHAGRPGTPGPAGLAGVSRELAFLDAQGGRPRGFAGTTADRNARLFLP